MAISHRFKKYFFNTSWLLFERVARTVIQVVVGIIVTRYLGPERFGLLSYAASYIGIYAAITSLGMDSIVVQMLVQSSEKRTSILSTSLILRLLSGCFAMIMIVVSLLLTHESSESSVLILVISLSLVIQAFNVFDYHFQAIVASKYFVYASVFQNLVSSVLRIAGVIIHAPIIYFAWLGVVDAFSLALGLSFYFFKTKEGSFKWAYDYSLAKDILQRSWPLILATVAVTVYMRIDQIMIKNMLNASSVGLYAAAVRLSEGWYFVPVIISSSVFPAIVKTKMHSEQLFQDSLRSLYSILTWLFILLAVPIALLSNTIIILLLGKDFEGAGPVLAIHIWSAYFVFLGVANSRWLIIENLQMIDFLRTLAGAVSNIALNVFLIPRYGIQGAAVSTLVSYSLSSFFFLLLFRKGRHNLLLMAKAFIPQPSLVYRLATSNNHN